MSAKSDPASTSTNTASVTHKTDKKKSGNVLSRQTSCSALGASQHKPGKDAQTTKLGASFVGLFASKRLAKRLTSRFLHSRTRSTLSQSRLSGLTIHKEPTYRMEPKTKFDPDVVEEITEKILKLRLEGFKYSPILCSTMSRMLSDEIKDKVKALNFDRYKIVVLVFIGEKNNQGLVISSRCAWDDKFDNSATTTYQSDSMHCTATVFGIYNE